MTSFRVFHLTHAAPSFARAALLLTGLSTTACGSSEPASVDRDGREVTEDDDDEGSDESSAPDAGKTSSSSGKKSDAGKDGTSTGKDAGAAASGSLWCKAKAVLDKRCTACHDGEGTAGSPMGLTTFADTQKSAPSAATKKNYELIATRIHDTRDPMPPAGNMPAAEIAALDAWIEAGAKGDDADCGGGSESGPKQASAWPAECTKENTYQFLAHDPSDPKLGIRVARGSEVHPQVFFDAPWGNEAVQAIAMRSVTDNKKVLHHWILYSNAGAFITGWAPGKDDGAPLPDDVGMYLPSGARSMRLDMHYYNRDGAADERDMSGVEICAVPKAQFRKNTATVYMGFASLGQGLVLAPANKMGHESTGTCRVSARQPVHLLTASPHAHTYARAMRFTVTKANGTKITLHEGPFNFEEQSAYPLKEEVILNTGDVVTTTCVYDNPTNRNITFGENTGNEMCFNFALYYPMGALSCGF